VNGNRLMRLHGVPLAPQWPSLNSSTYFVKELTRSATRWESCIFTLSSRAAMNLSFFATLKGEQFVDRTEGRLDIAVDLNNSRALFGV
jgi:hypothetical protein